MPGPLRRSFVLLLLVFTAVFAVAQTAASAQPHRAKYLLQSDSKNSLVALNSKTGRLSFKAKNGHYGMFTVVVKHGPKKTIYHFSVKKPKSGQRLPTRPIVVRPTRPTSRPVTIVIITIVPITITGPGPPGTPPPTPTLPTTTPPPTLPPPPRSAPHNVTPVLHVNGGTISWSTDAGADSFHGAISTDARGTSDRTTTYTVLGWVTSWTPAPPACGQTLYYGVASEGNQGELWTANEVSITGPACGPPNFAPVLYLSGGTIYWSGEPGAATFHGAISTDARGTTDRTTTYTNLGLATSWTPAPPACGQTLYYGVASEGNQGELWTANEVAISGPPCPPPPPPPPRRLLAAPMLAGIPQVG
jgi:hypothetical protein